MSVLTLSATAAAVIGVAGGALTAAESAGTAQTPGVQITQLPDRLRVEINGKLFTEYHFKDVPRPYCYPLLGPDGLPMTRNWPMKDLPDEEHDHKHHRSFWFAHGAVNGHDFWGEEAGFGKTVHQEFAEIKSGKDAGVIRERNRWVAADGTVVCTDERTLRVYARPDTERLFDFEITLTAGDKDVVFGDTKEGTMALRLAESMRLTRPPENGSRKARPGLGHIVNSEGVRDGQTWGKRAAWCDYYGPVQGRIVGVAIFDHPRNLRHPTWWHVRDYGLFAANPFGEHNFENLPDKHAGDYTLPAGKSLTLRYRFYLHEGDERQAKVAEHYQEYVAGRE